MDVTDYVLTFARVAATELGITIQKSGASYRKTLWTTRMG